LAAGESLGNIRVAAGESLRTKRMCRRRALA